MFLRSERQRRRMFVCLVDSREIGRRSPQYRLGYLGSVTFGEPVSMADSLRFWTAFDKRWRAVADRHPDRISASDEAWVRGRIAERIPRPAGEDGLRRLRTAAALRDLTDNLSGFDADPAVADALVRLAAETRAKEEVRCWPTPGPGRARRQQKASSFAERTMLIGVSRGAESRATDAQQI